MRHRIVRLLDWLIALLVLVWSRDALVWLGVTLLGVASVSGWLETPLQGVIRGYTFRLSGRVAVSDGLTNPARLLSVALPCLLAAGLVVGGRLWRPARWLQPHVGAAMLLVTLAFAVGVICRNQTLVDALANQNQERIGIHAFASLVGGFSATMPDIPLAGTAALADRAQSMFTLIGYGWWLALAGAGLLVATSGRDRRRRGAVVFVLLWGTLTVVTLGALAAPAVIAESRRLEGEALYAAGQYSEALDRFREVQRSTPALRENGAFQYRVGAARFWLGDETAPEARLFLAQNLKSQGELQKAEFQLTLALATAPESRLLRRALAEVFADLGVRDFREDPRSARSARWERALTIDDGVLRLRYYLAHAYVRMDDRDQTRAISQATELLGVTRFAVTRSDLYALLGDCYFKARRDGEARAMYRLALRAMPLVSHQNYAAQRGLSGL